MDERENRLQAELERLEAGKELADVQQGSPEQDAELLALAERLRMAEWPEREPGRVKAQRDQMLRAYEKETKMKNESNQSRDWFKGWHLPALLSAGAFASILCVGLVIFSLMSLFKDRQLASISESEKYSRVALEDARAISAITKQISNQQAVLVNPHGLVEIMSGDTWQAAQAGDFLTAGSQLRTGALSSAALLFKDGSSVQIGSSSELLIESLDAGAPGSARQIVMVQSAGRSVYDVASVDDETSRFVVHTPYGDATAHGTAFAVRVSEVQAALYVTEGSVEMSGKETSVMVDTGQMTSVGPEDDPLPPTTYITGVGEVNYIGDTWVIDGETFTTHEFTLVMGNPQVGDIVFFEAHVLDDGTRVADLIVLVRRNPNNTFSLTGTVEVIADPLWTINGQDIAVTDVTEVEEGVVVGSLVLVEGTIMPDGTLQALTIRLLEDQPGTPFDFTAVVQEIGEAQWLVGDVPIAVDAETEIDEGLLVGDLVRVQGWVLDDGTWLASSIHRVSDENSSFEFIGEIDSMDPWVVAGIAFETRDWTVIDEDLEIGDMVQVKGEILEDGTWVASEVTRYDQTLTIILIGRVFSMDPWVVSGVTLNVDEETYIADGITIGMLVRVEMVMQADGTLHVVRIDPLSGYEWDEGCQTVVVRVVGLDGNQIQFEGWPELPLGDNVQVEGDLQPGSIVIVTICFDADMNVTIIIIIILFPPDVEEPPDPYDGEKVMICHKPHGNNPHIIVVSQSAVPAHLGHGDNLGPCP
jgi:hypothetical protein